MPTTAKAKKAIAVALYNPDKLYARNKGLKGMTSKQLKEMIESATVKKKGRNET